MKLLFDENLSRRLVRLLSDIYPGSEHVVTSGLESADDRVVWQYAASRELTIVSKDWDFLQLSTLKGAPPKVVWLRLGNVPWTRLWRCCESGTSICSGSPKIRPRRFC